MKKLLIASTALVATAGIASAQDLGVALTGNAEMGIFRANDLTLRTTAAGVPATNAAGNFILDDVEGDTQFFTDIDVTFTMTGESDNGLSFGANIDLDESTGRGAFGGATQGGEAIFISFAGATLTMGDTDGALDARVPEMALAGGSLADDETAHLGFNHSDGYALFGLLSAFAPALGTAATSNGLSLDGNGDGQIARFDYTYSSFVFSASVEQANNGNDDYAAGNSLGVPAGFDANPIYGLAVAYAGEFSGVSVNAGLGYQTQEDVANTTSLGATAGLANGISFGATFSKSNVDDDLQDAYSATIGVPNSFDLDEITHVGLGLGYEMNNIAVGVNWGKYEFDGDELSGYGLAASYDLGGGLSMRAGYGNSKVDIDGIDGDDQFDTFSAGVRMDF